MTFEPSAPDRGGQRGWWLEDAHPGRVLRHPGGRTIGEAEHVWLAWVTHNLSDVHGNADAMRRSEWGAPLVLGMLTAAVVIGLAQPAAPPPEHAAAGLPGGWISIRLAAPVVAGDTLTAESEIGRVSARMGAPTGTVRRLIRGRNQRGEVVTLIEEERRVPRRPGAAPAAADFSRT